VEEGRFSAASAINEKGKGTTSVVPPSSNVARLQPLRGMWSGHSCPLLLPLVLFFASS
jgi:hypothetical protein